jgi:hypothetical protein
MLLIYICYKYIYYLIRYAKVYIFKLDNRFPPKFLKEESQVSNACIFSEVQTLTRAFSNVSATFVKNFSRSLLSIVES